MKETLVKEEFDWACYESNYGANNKLVPNLSITGSSKNKKCFSYEPYAQNLFDLYTKSKFSYVNKDLKTGDTVNVVDVVNIRNEFIDVEIAGGMLLTLDLSREKRFLSIYGYDDVYDFTNDLRNPQFIKKFIENDIIGYVTEGAPNVRISLWEGHLISTKNEFFKEISNPTKAYTARVKEANRGGFFVEVQGVDAFLPGSLAAPNKIIDFESYIDKEIIVMIEDYIKEMNSFIVSHKKYLNHIIPIKLKELDTKTKYEGFVTGCSKYGIFVEFDEIFTGLLHTSKMDEDTLKLFKDRSIITGSTIEFFISEVTKDNRVILTKEDPMKRLEKMNSFIIENANNVLESTIIAILNFGILVEIGEYSGLVPIKEFKKRKIAMNNLKVGDTIDVMFDELKDEKIIFKLP